MSENKIANLNKQAEGNARKRRACCLKLLIALCSLLTVNCHNPYMVRDLQPIIDARERKPEPVEFYTVTFDSMGGTEIPEQIVEKGGLVEEPLTKPVRAGYGFYNWYKEVSYINRWDFAVDKVTSDITLYAMWVQNAVVVVLTIQEIVSGNFAFDPITVSRTESDGIVTAVVRVDKALYDPGSIIWEISGVGAYAGETIIETGAEFWIDASDVRYNTPGGHILRLQVSQNGVVYRANVSFTIVE